MHCAGKLRQAQGLTGEREKVLSDRWQMTHQMKGYVKPLKTILDAQIPNGRDKA